MRFSIVLAAVLILLPFAGAQVHTETPFERARKEGAALKAKGDAAGALAAYERAARLNPKSAEVEDEIGFLYAVMKRTAQAKAHLERAVNLDPKFAPAHYHLGVLYWLEQDPNRAIPELQTAVALSPKVVDYQLRLGVAFH